MGISILGTGNEFLIVLQWSVLVLPTVFTGLYSLFVLFCHVLVVIFHDFSLSVVSGLLSGYLQVKALSRKAIKKNKRKR